MIAIASGTRVELATWIVFALLLTPPHTTVQRKPLPTSACSINNSIETMLLYAYAYNDCAR